MITNILILLVALLHFYFLILEMFLWTTPKGIKTFGMTLEKARDTEELAANQGLYNGFLSAGLIWGLVHPDKAIGYQVQVFFLSCVVIAGCYGAYSVSRKIFFIQALPAMIALGLRLVF